MKNNSEANLAIIIPAYNALKFFKLNEENWKQTTKLLGADNIYLIEDSKDETMADFAKQNGWNYYSKENGNWGSVLNFAKKIKFTQKYLAIVDADDILNNDQLAILLRELKDRNEDVVWTNQKVVSFLTGKFFDDQKDFYIHNIFFKRDLFAKTKALPENVFFMDIYFILSIENEMKSVYKSETFPYTYFLEIEGQSVNSNKFNTNKFNSNSVLSSIFDWSNQYDYDKKYLCPILNDRNYLKDSKFRYLKNCYKNATNNDDKRKIIDIWVKELENGKPSTGNKIPFLRIRRALIK